MSTQYIDRETGRAYKSWTPIRIQLPPTYPAAPPLVLADEATARRSGLRLNQKHPDLRPGTPVFTCSDLAAWGPGMNLPDLFLCFMQTSFDAAPLFFAGGAQPPAAAAACEYCRAVGHSAAACPRAAAAAVAPPAGGGGGGAAGGGGGAAGGFFLPPQLSAGAGALASQAPALPSPGFFPGGAQPPPAGTPLAQSPPAGALAAQSPASAPAARSPAGGAPAAGGSRPATPQAAPPPAGRGDPGVRAEYLKALSSQLAAVFTELAAGAAAGAGGAAAECARLRAATAAARARRAACDARAGEAAAVRASAAAREAALRAWREAAAPHAAAGGLRFAHPREAKFCELVAARNAARDLHGALEARVKALERSPGPLASFLRAVEEHGKGVHALYVARRRVEAAAAAVGAEPPPEEAHAPLHKPRTPSVTPDAALSPGGEPGAFHPAASAAAARPQTPAAAGGGGQPPLPPQPVLPPAKAAGWGGFFGGGGKK